MQPHQVRAPQLEGAAAGTWTALRLPLPGAHSVVGNDERPICIPLPSCSTADDPAIFCGMLPASFFFTEHRHLGNRWSLCAKASGLGGQPHCVAVLHLRSGCSELQQVSCAPVDPCMAA